MMEQRGARALSFLLASSCLALLVFDRQTWQPVSLEELKSQKSLKSLPQFSVSSTTQLPSYDVGGSLQVPQRTSEMPSAGSVGTLGVTSTGGDDLGEVSVKTLPPPPAPAPKVVRFGDVGVAPAGCPNCPVIDTKVVAMQKAMIHANQARIERLKKLIEVNKQKIEHTVDNMHILKTVMGSSVFDMKEAVKKLDMDINSKIQQAEDRPGYPGRQGPRGYAGPDGENGVDGPPGHPGRPGRPGPQGRMGPTGFRGYRGPRGIPGPAGKQGGQGVLGPMGPRGIRGKLGPSSQDLRCSRIGGQMYKDVCFKSNMLLRNKDNVPSGCRVWQPKKPWNEGDWWQLAQMFRTKTQMTSRIDRDVDGGRCDNHEAVMSFSQGSPAKVWVNKNTFSFNPTAAGSTCNLYNDENSVAVYACSI
mmetsp:Transcript_1666/g.2695  ORF Transcript_1666/g.2695 Transcript_1666/m.2695 type:complete len:415 (+) Transcript_1666:30-1274(+)